MTSIKVIVFFLLSISLYADQPANLVVRLWWELEPAVYTGDGYPISEEKAVQVLLEYARNILSAMLYGYRFIHEPSDTLRAVSEQFELQPIAELPWGDRNLKVVSSDVRDKRIYVQISYRLQDFQITRHQAWSSNTVPISAGTGKADVFNGPQEKLTSVKDAIRNAIRNHLKARSFNKPREIVGEVLLWEAPITYIKAGSYLTLVKVKLRVEETVPYKIF